MHSDARTSPAQGFTLLEVIVALAVVALGLIAAFNGVIQITSGATYMRERTLSNWVAMNELSRIRLSGVMPEVSETDGDVEFANSTYRWRATVSETGVENLRRIDIEVDYVDTADNVIGRATGFVAPRSPNSGTSSWSSAASTAPAPGDDLVDPTDPDEDSGDGNE
jgi:general secretion pathway protein I